MKDIHNKYNLFFIGLILLLHSCKEDIGVSKPLYSDGKGPQAVSDIQIENGPGKAVLRYKIPGDVDLSYIMAKYEIRPGVYRETKSSKANDSLIVDGFGEEKEYKVEVTAYDMGENPSESKIVVVHPSTPPIVKLAQTIQLVNDFGGMGIVVNNPSEADFTISVSEQMATSNMERPVKTFYTKSKAIAFNVRGYNPKPVTFVVLLKDKYGNTSQPIVKEILPIEEVLLDRNLFVGIQYENDAIPLNSSRGISAIWNNAFVDDAYHTDGSKKMPLSVTFDLGKKVKLSRFKYFQRTVTTGITYNHLNLKKFELYGSNNPAADWANWELLGVYESFKPSGLPVGQNSNEDLAFARAGEEFNIVTTAAEVRYLRVRAIETWSGLDDMQITEMQFWGQYK